MQAFDAYRCHLAQQQALRKRQLKLRRARQAERSSQPPSTSHTSLPNSARPTFQQTTGSRFEQTAEALLTEQGLQILARRLTCNTGEVDLVARDADVLAFIEVRRRASKAFGGAAASVDRAKQARLIRTAQFYLPMLTRCYFAGKTPICRFDVVAFEPDEIRWLKNTMQDRLSVR